MYHTQKSIVSKDKACQCRLWWVGHDLLYVTVSETKSFLGLDNHLKRYIKDLFILTAPHRVYQKGESLRFHWQRGCTEFIDRVEKGNEHCASLSDSWWEQAFWLVCDVCGYGIGAVLMQEGSPVAYYSYKFNSAYYWLQWYTFGKSVWKHEALLVVISHCLLERRKEAISGSEVLSMLIRDLTMTLSYPLGSETNYVPFF